MPPMTLWLSKSAGRFADRGSRQVMLRGLQVATLHVLEAFLWLRGFCRCYGKQTGAEVSAL